MNATNRSDYFPSADEDRSNGHNGNGHPKIFSLKPATDPDTLAILDARRRVLAEKRLTRSMKALFCEVLDRALNPTMRGFLCKGVVAASDTTLARHFMVSARTVYTWKYAVADLGYFWISKKFVTNHEPITVYNITALHPPKESEMQNADGASQTGPVRYGGWVDRDGKHHLGALGARTPGQPGLPLPGSRQPPPAAESASLQGISGETGKKLRVTPEEKIGSHPKPISGETRNKDRVTPEANFGSDPKPISGETRSQLPVSPEADCRLKIDSEGVLESIEVHTHIPDKKEAIKLPEFEPLDRKCAIRLRPKLAEEMIGFCQVKILQCENTRNQVLMGKEKIAAYRQRIKEVKAWAAGAL